MGLLSRLLGGSSDKERLIRRLLRARIEKDPSAKRFGQDAAFADSVPVGTLMGLPEATIVTCVETWARFKQQGLPEVEIARQVAAFRRKDSRGNDMEETIRIIVQEEHSQGGFLPADHIDYCIREARQSYAC